MELLCEGRGNNWYRYFEEEGHMGCIPENNPIILCASFAERCTREENCSCIFPFHIIEQGRC